MSLISEKYNDANVVVWLFVSLAAINWGLVGAADINLVEMAVTQWAGLDTGALDIAYIAIGAVGVYDILETMGKIN